MLRAVPPMDSSISANGIDIRPDRVQQAVQRNRENTRVKFVCGDAHAMEFQSNSFDLVYSRKLLQYLKEKEKAVAEMTRVCKPGGTVLPQDLDGQLLWHYQEDARVKRRAGKV